MCALFQGSSGSEDETRPGTAAAAAAQKREERLRKFRELHLKRVRGGGRSGTGSRDRFLPALSLIRGEAKAEGAAGVARPSSARAQVHRGLVLLGRLSRRFAAPALSHPQPALTDGGSVCPFSDAVLHGASSDRWPGPTPGRAPPQAGPSPAIPEGCVSLAAVIECFSCNSPFCS